MLDVLKHKDVQRVKESENTVVAKAADCFYKVRKLEKGNPATDFEIAVAQAFADEYAAMGLIWELTIANDSESVYLIEKRQKLEVCNSEEYSYDDLLRRSYSVQRMVENKLEFPSLLAQIKATGKFNNVDKIVLARKCENDFADYALWKNSIVSLGESGRFLALRDDCGGKWIQDRPTDAVRVELSYGTFLFSSCNFTSTNRLIGALASETDAWWLFSNISINLPAVSDRLEKEAEDMLKQNLQIRLTGTSAPVKTADDFGSLAEECKKLIEK